MHAGQTQKRFQKIFKKFPEKKNLESQTQIGFKTKVKGQYK